MARYSITFIHVKSIGVARRSALRFMFAILLIPATA
jgi:hypothetical protein